MAVYKINKEVLLQEDFEFMKKQIEAKKQNFGDFGSGLDMSRSISKGLGNIADNYKKRHYNNQDDPFQPVSYPSANDYSSINHHNGY